MDPCRVWMFDFSFFDWFLIPLGSKYHAEIFIPRSNHPSINMVWNGINPNNNSGIQRFSHLDIPTKYQCLIGITILIPTGRFFDSIIDVHYGCHAFTCILVQHWSRAWRKEHSHWGGAFYSHLLCPQSNLSGCSFTRSPMLIWLLGESHVACLHQVHSNYWQALSQNLEQPYGSHLGTFILWATNQWNPKHSLHWHNFSHVQYPCPPWYHTIEWTRF
jgi:hypothetical protein